ncbi:MAG: hypothetical protein U0903_17840 [Planctomycetales bacterium]
MQRDLKIGLSLAVLLLGVVGALFFRRDDAEVSGLPELQNQEQWNRQIAEKTRSPYLHVDSASSPRSKPAPHATRPAGSPQWQAEDSPLVETQPAGTSQPRYAPAARYQPVTDAEVSPGRQADDPAEFRRPPAPQSPVRRTSPVIDSQKLPPGEVDAEETETPRVKKSLENSRMTAPQRSPQAALEASEEIAPKATIPQENAKPAPKTSVPYKAGGTPTDGKTLSSSSEPRRPMISPSAAPQTSPPGMFIPPKRVPFAMTPPVTPRRGLKPLDEEPADAPESDVAQAQKSQQRVYRIRQRDSLERIAEREYGDRRRATEIYEANRDTLESPHKLREGDDLVLP